MTNPLDHLLYAIARLMVARGVVFPAFAERMKAQYVAAARDAAGQTKLTDSLLSVTTGLQRRDIARLRSSQAPEPARPNHLSQLVSRWQTEESYGDAGGARPLPRQGPAPSFDALAASVRTDVHPRTMLDALVAAGTVEVQEGTVVLRQTSYQPMAGSEEQLTYLAQNVADHLEAARVNVGAVAAPHYERAVHYSHLSEAALAELDTLYRAKQQAVLEQINARAAELQPDERGPYRFRAGGYFYSTEEDAE